MPSTELDKTTKGLRQSNIELLRIVAMVMIVAHHFAIHGGFQFPANVIGVNRCWVQFLQMGGNIGVNIFVLIAGYFLISADTIKTRKLIKFWGQMFFYSLLLFIGFVLAGIRPFELKEFIPSLTPVIYSRWWFASTYFVLYLLSPYINRFLGTFDKKQYMIFLALLCFCWSIIPTFTGKPFQSNSLLWFIFLYSLAGYFKLFGPKITLSSGKLFTLATVGILLTFLSVVVFDILGTKIALFGKHTTFFYGMQRLPVLTIAILMCLGFFKLNISYSKLINTISAATFGVYLIHDHLFVRQFLWETVFNSASYAQSNRLIPYSLFVIGIVFAGCTVLELIRIHWIEKSYMPLIHKIADFIDKKKAQILSEKFPGKPVK